MKGKDNERKQMISERDIERRDYFEKCPSYKHKQNKKCEQMRIHGHRDQKMVVGIRVLD